MRINVSDDLGAKEPYPLLVDIQTGPSCLQIIMEVLMKLQTELPHDTAIPAVKKIKLTDKNMAMSFTRTMNNIKSKLLPRIPFTMMPK